MYNIIVQCVLYVFSKLLFIFNSPEPKPVFHSNNSHRKSLNKCPPPHQDVISPQHEKLIHYMNQCEYIFYDFKYIFKLGLK